MSSEHTQLNPAPLSLYLNFFFSWVKCSTPAAVLPWEPTDDPKQDGDLDYQH